jgi:hypothetical protein
MLTPDEYYNMKLIEAINNTLKEPSGWQDTRVNKWKSYDLRHSAKGTTWSDHKYIRKEGKRYIYRDDATATKDLEKANSDKWELEYDQTQFANQTLLPYLGATFRQKFNVEFLKQDPEHMKFHTDEYDEDGYEIMLTPEEYVKYCDDKLDGYARDLKIADMKVSSIQKEIDRHKNKDAAKKTAVKR